MYADCRVTLARTRSTTCAAPVRPVNIPYDIRVWSGTRYSGLSNMDDVGVGLLGIPSLIFPRLSVSLFRLYK